MRLRGKSGVILLLTTMLVLTSCQGHLSSAHRIRIPVLSAVPAIIPCPGMLSDECIVLLHNDYKNMVLELKQACIAGGYELEDCK